VINIVVLTGIIMKGSRPIWGLAKKQITWLAAHLRSRIVDERGGGSSTVETLIWIGLVVGASPPTRYHRHADQL
jgi:hypothetical protein